MILLTSLRLENRSGSSRQACSEREHPHQPSSRPGTRRLERRRMKEKKRQGSRVMISFERDQSAVEAEKGWKPDRAVPGEKADAAAVSLPMVIWLEKLTHILRGHTGAVLMRPASAL